MDRTRNGRRLRKNAASAGLFSRSLCSGVARYVPPAPFVSQGRSTPFAGSQAGRPRSLWLDARRYPTHVPCKRDELILVRWRSMGQSISDNFLLMLKALETELVY